MDKQAVEKYLESNNSRQAEIINLYFENTINLEKAKERLGEKLNTRTRGALIYLSDTGHKKAKKLLDLFPIKKRYDRQIELMKTLIDGDLHLKDVAEIHCISLDTLNKHVADLKNELGVETLTGLAVALIKKGIIKLEDIN